MLTLDADQWQALRADDAGHFVAAVADPLLAQCPSLAGDRAAVLARMNAMHRLAADVGFVSNAHVIRLLHLAASAPDLHEQPGLRAWLLRPGQSPEQRLDDLLAVVDHRIVLSELQGPR